MTSGVYMILCRVNGSRYVGSSVNVGARWSNHKYYLRRGRHINPKLQASWNKYGEAEFAFEVLEEVASEKLFAAEAAWFEAAKPDLNINPRPDAPMRGAKMTAEHKAKIVASLKGNQRRAGTKHSAETRAKMGATRRLICNTEEGRARLRRARAIQLGRAK